MQTEEFVWHDLWGGWDIDSVHIVGDRMIAHSRDEVRIYQRLINVSYTAVSRDTALRLSSPPPPLAPPLPLWGGRATYMGQRGDQYWSTHEPL